MTYVRNAWYVASWDRDLEIGKPFHITILGDPIVLYRTERGQVAALEDRCVHRSAPLSLGRCEGENLRCMYHGLLFDPLGKVIEIPGQDIIPAQAKVKSYAVVERHSWIWVWMGSDSADEALIPPAIGLDDPDYLLGHGSLDYEAEARLINDNLLDFSHLTYVHANSFGAGDQHAYSQPSLTPLERGVRFQRWVTDMETSVAGINEPADAWMSYDFLIPGILLMGGANFPIGTASQLNFQPPADFSNAIGGVTFTNQAVTPMDKKTARYFFSWGPHRNFGDEALRDGLMAVAGKAFAEDKAMIEAQQRVINMTAEPRVMPTAHDRGVTIFGRLVDKLSRQEDTGRPDVAA